MHGLFQRKEPEKFLRLVLDRFFVEVVEPAHQLQELPTCEAFIEPAGFRHEADALFYGEGVFGQLQAID